VFLALCAIALSAMWPLLAHLGPAGHGQLVEVCSINGSFQVDLRLADGGEQTPSRLAPHCPFCTLGGDRVAISRPDLLAMVAPVASIVVQFIVAELPTRSALLHPLARPRAPPVFS
jgi:hypothetical protein